MSENKTLSKPKQLFSNALKAVKGDSTLELVEQFTSEMTLVAEGLCEDQARVHQNLEQMNRDMDASIQKLDSERQVLETTLTENNRDLNEKIKELSSRVRDLENEMKQKPKEKKVPWMKQATILVAIAAGAWVLVTILNLFRPA